MTYILSPLRTHLFIHVLTHKLGRQEDDSEDSDDTIQTEEPLSLRTSRTSSTVVDRQGFYESGDDGMGYNKKSRGGWLSKRKRAGSKHLSRKKGSGLSGDIEQRAGTSDPTRRKPRLRNSILTARRAKVANEKAIDELKKGFGRVYVEVASAWMFLLRDGTLISISQNTKKPFGASVGERLRVRDTVLRSSGDASLLLEGLLDLVVDDAVEVVDKYHDVILKAERSILLKPNMKTVRGCEVVGFLSHQAKVYLADVHDHVEYIMSSLDMFTSISENLINYTFNIVSYETNQVMRGLTIATVIFFPLTFLTGYFGMNFDVMPSVQEHSETMFWEIAIPVMIVIVTAFLFPDIQKLFHFIKKRMATRKYDY
ncbi:Magnesium transport protein CorA [Rhizoctonia solani AG-1 IB]|uniref:Magnesium transport protein CorA n=1 Tax=Thanatephorus cucumeris (strain AG1-IB / isolate 7/3/14) TaxID=1108050 RepID=M5BTT8_THACB|nr:Magnesium transport protein CorA [Rhizoctonia solani AG-1 IB]